MGIPTGGEAKVGAQAGAEVALLMDSSNSVLLAIFIFLQQYFKKIKIIKIRITTVRISPTPKYVAPEADMFHNPILVVSTLVSSLGCSSDELEPPIVSILVRSRSKMTRNESLGG